MKQKDKGISSISIVITSVVVMIFLAITISVSCKLTSNYHPINENDENIIKKQENCQHDWVITSKYDLVRDAYKTISKCSKCGKEI